MILDTNALSALIARDAALLRVLGNQALSIPVIVLGEYRYGLLQSRERALIGRWLDGFVTHCTLLSVEPATVPHYAAVRAELKKKGRPIPANNVWIAALTRQHARPLVSRDAHFDSVSSIERVYW